MTDGTHLDPQLSVTAGQPETVLGRVESDTRTLIEDGDGVALYEDRALRILLLEAPLELRLIGQGDLSHRAAIERALRRTERGVSDLVVDLTELEFIDVGGVRQLIDHAGVLGIDGRSVRITGASVAVLRVFQVCLSTSPSNLFIETRADTI